MRTSNAKCLVAAIATTITSDTIELTLPVSALSLEISKGDLVPVEESKTGALVIEKD